MFFIHSVLHLLIMISNSLMYVLSYFCLQLSNYKRCIFKLPTMNMSGCYFFRYFTLYIQLLYCLIHTCLLLLYLLCKLPFIIIVGTLSLSLFCLVLWILFFSLSDFHITSTFSPSYLSSSPPPSFICTRQFIVYPIAFEIFKITF